MELKIGDVAPAFNTIDQNGKLVSLHDYIGKKIALYFYPKDDTTTCTSEACSLRDSFDILVKNKINILGVSTDDEKSHKKFEEKYGLPYTLLVDTDKKIVNDYSVWGEKSMFGNKYMGTIRKTFLINEEGKIEHIISKVESKNHAKQILKVWGLK